MAKSILHTIERNMPTFSKGQKRIADYILQNYDKAAFMTASKLGKLSGVSESTVVRFASELGYDGYPSMQRALQEPPHFHPAHPGGGQSVRRTGCAVRRDPVRYGQAADGGGRGGQD